MIVTMREAKAQLSKLTARAEAGEKIIIARGREPVARLMPLAGGKRRPVFGALKGKLNIPDAFFFEPLPEEELALWEGGDEAPIR
jgi:prevent-host-death family protein